MSKIFKAVCVVMFLLTAQEASSQIGYQVAVMDPATGEPKANRSVNVSISLEDNSGKQITTLNRTMQTNEFGVVAVELGDSNTFTDMDWNNLPLWVTATVDGVNIGKTQVLSVPVAEHAKHTGSLTKEILTSKEWITYVAHYSDGSETIHSYKFENDDTFLFTDYQSDNDIKYRYAKGSYVIEGDHILINPYYSETIMISVGYIMKLYYSKNYNCIL